MTVSSDEAERLAQNFVGPRMRVSQEKSLPEDGLFFISRGEQNDYFIFSVYERVPTRVGHTVYIGVSKANARVIELGQSGE
ncbi:hypothetical protein [Dyella sp.]|uniref:hypothetical protein n=1 Tax=Dyella sp. TaxID=1869338 RepID=UPI002D79BFE8|nr:hypothetical protein [Dyella sp.]HET7329898.1 hypothetical protein [Dyella sp.]